MIGTIQEVVAELDRITLLCREQSNPLGFFPALYRRVTVEVAKAIERGSFEDNERMEKLDILFAQRYIDAFDAFQAGKECSSSWAISFAAAEESKLTTLQHLLLGMNAHISLDLGIAAAQAETDDPLSLRQDFCTINALLGSMINDTQLRLTRIFGGLGLIDKLLGPIDETLSLYSIAYARDRAWTQTLELCLAPDEPRHAGLITNRDTNVAKFSQHLIHPPKRLIRFALLLVRLLEKGTIQQRIDILNTDRNEQNR